MDPSLISRRSHVGPVSALIITTCILANLSRLGQLADGFHLSFGQRIIRSAASSQNPQLNPANTLIRPIECRNINNQSEAGICMFSIDCMQNKGVPLSVCKHNYFVGTCCKLPDYNNFVGIVYDLRDTETNQILEARKVAASSAPSSAPLISAQPGPASSSLPESSVNLSATQPDTPNSTVLWSKQPQKLTSEQPKLEDKYRISSSSLFSVGVGPPNKSSPNTASKANLNSSESARNADGPAVPVVSLLDLDVAAESLTRQQPQLVVSSELDSFHIQSLPVSVNYSILSNSTSQSDQQIASGANAVEQQQQPHKHTGDYEIIKEENLDVLSTLSSAHSAPSSSPSQNSVQSPTTDSQHLADSVAPPVKSNASPITSELLNSLEDKLTTEASRVIVANDHYKPPSTVAVPLVNESASTAIAGDQEFTLSSAPVSQSTPNPEAPSTSYSLQGSNETAGTPADIRSTTLKDRPSTTSQSSPSTLTSSGPFVSDLVSSHSATGSIQTTTPFTTSLSTAILPNVSSHAWAPTESPALVSSTSQHISTQPSRPQSYQNFATSQASSTYGQLYSNQHSSGSTASLDLSTDGQERPPTNYNSYKRPGMIPSTLQASSKIVTGTSNSNNLLPGLSGLQSAILSHIPFKIASGLSSGLSSYLQAAMKPSGGGGRPLISSNTAPALGYHQQMLSANNSTSSKPTSAPSSTTSTSVSQSSSSAAQISLNSVKFPSSDMLGTSTSDIGGVSKPGLNLWDQTFGSQTQQSGRDSTKETRQICGRPQVNQLNEVSKRRVARIVGGNQSNFGQWPWMVSLRQWRKGAFLHKCGAALLNENWAITAAHCVENVKAPDLLLRLGEFDVSNQEEPYPYLERRVKSVVSHPKFDPKTFEYDLALLRFADPVKFERNIIPVCVPNGNDSYVDRMATVIGWGRLYEDGPLPDIIQHVDVPIITNNECERMYKNAGYIEEIPEMFICAGISKGGRDSCEGDSGGPLTMVDNDGRSYLVGIISWGIDTTKEATSATIFINLRHYQIKCRAIFLAIKAAGYRTFSPHFIFHSILNFRFLMYGDSALWNLFPTIKPNATRWILLWSELTTVGPSSKKDIQLTTSNNSNNSSARFDLTASATTQQASSEAKGPMTHVPLTTHARLEHSVQVSGLQEGLTQKDNTTHRERANQIATIPMDLVSTAAMMSSIATTTSHFGIPQYGKIPSPTPTKVPASYASTTAMARKPYTTQRSKSTPRVKLTTLGLPIKVENPNEVQPDWANLIHTTHRPYVAKRDCGVRPMKREGRVVGGRDSHLGEFPWSVLIRETTMLGFFVKTKCGGVLIDLKWVLTAAHCQPGMFGSLVVVVGQYDLGAGTSGRLKPIIRKVKRMIVHRDYNPSNFDNDIALLELESPYQIQPHVVPICLPDKDEEFIGRPAMVAGWGKLSFGGPVPSILQVARLPVIGNKQCQEMYHNSGHMKIISDSFLCAGYENGGQDSCEGDSGGPLQVQRTDDNKWVLVGTVSHGIKCAEPNLPGIYIRTGAYLPWIKSVMHHQDTNKRYGHRRQIQFS